MKNLFKNIVRSFKNNKISLIGLSFLVFFGVGSFCVLQNTTSNITNEYNTVASEGAIHDLTISELYDVGNPGFKVNNAGVLFKYPQSDPTSFEKYDDFSTAGTTIQNLTTVNYQDIGAGQFGDYYFPIPNQIETENNTFIRTYHATLDVATSTGLYQSFAESGDPTITSFDIVISETYEEGQIPPEVQTLQDMLPSFASWSDDDIKSVINTNVFARDYKAFTDLVNNQTSVIYNAMTSSNTPMANYLNDEEDQMKDRVEFRRFQSLNITATKDKIFYKVIKSDPTDSIDKMVLFKDVNDRTGNALFNQDDWAPYNSKIEFFNSSGELYTPGQTVGSLVVPASFNDVATQKLSKFETFTSDDEKFLYSQILQIRFKRMLAANTTHPDYVSLFKALAQIDLSRSDYYTYITTQGLATFNLYLHDYYDGCHETVALSSNGNVVFTWTEVAGTIQTCTISNWTNRFSIVNPQYLKNSGKSVLASNRFSQFEPFSQWYLQQYEKEFSGNILQEEAISWLNTLNYEQFAFWIDPAAIGHDVTYTVGLDHEITVSPDEWDGIRQENIVSCGSFNQIVWGCGLTPDFMYPVVDISRPTPNTSTECLTYCNTSGYQTIKLAYINAPVEEYLVGKFKGGFSHKETLDLINAKAREIMIFPETTRAAYLATDVSNVLNASAFRIAYIPSLVNVIHVVTVIMSIFIGILCILICGIIIKRYVENNRISIGIMRANGISKFKIVLSLIPFALLPALVGGIGAYLIGFFLQAPALLLFSNYWMLPTPLLSFSVWPLVACVIVPFVLFVAISAFSTLTVLRQKAVDLMKAGSEFKTNAFSRIVKKPFKHFGILTRFRVSLAFNSLLRLTMLALMSTLTMSSLVFAMTTFDRLSQSQVINSSQFDYNFNIELTTPTSTGGPYSYFDVSKTSSQPTDEVKGLGETNTSQYIYNTQWDLSTSGYEWTDPNYKVQLTKPYQRTEYQMMQDLWNLSGTGYYSPTGYYDISAKKGQLQFPNAADADGQVSDLTYLQNRINSRLLLDYNIGIGTLSSNPWEIALALMPANSRNLAADSYNYIINEVGRLVYEANHIFFDTLKKEEVPQTAYNEEEGWVNKAHPAAVAKARVAAGKWANFKTIESDTRIYNVFLPFFTKQVKGEETTFILNTDISVVGYLWSQFRPAYIELLEAIYSDAPLIRSEYPISYGMVPINFDLEDGGVADEFYTYIDATIESVSSGKRIDPLHQIKIEGIKSDSNFIKLTDNRNHNLNYVLYQEEPRLARDGQHAIVINAYAAHKYGIGVGSTFSIEAKNTVDRFERKIHPNRFVGDISNKTTFKVVGVSRGTNDEAFYITQGAANDILGLPNSNKRTWNKTHKFMLWTPGSTLEPWSKTNTIQLADLSGIGCEPNMFAVYSFDSNTGAPIATQLPKFNFNIPNGFNGIYTKNDSGKPITSMMSLYSYTGLYPGSSVYRTSGQGQNKMVTLLKCANNLAIANLMTGIDDVNEGKYYEACNAWVKNLDPSPDDEKAYEGKISSFINELVTYYGETTMITAICGAMDVAASDQVYQNLISTFNLAEAAAISIIIPITIIIVAVISNLIINDSKKMAAMLKALGYADRKNAMSILALFVPTIFFGLLLAIPVSFGLVAAYQSLIFTSANILVDVSQKWWYYVVAVLGIGSILVGTYAIGYVSLKRDRLVNQIK